MEQDQDKYKLPKYYEQIYNLMLLMNNAYMKRRGQYFFRAFRQFYSRVRFELSKQKREFYDMKIREIENKFEFDEVMEARNEMAAEARERSRAIIRPVYDLQVRIYGDLEDTKIFTFLKKNINDMEVA